MTQDNKNNQQNNPTKNAKPEHSNQNSDSRKMGEQETPRKDQMKNGSNQRDRDFDNAERKQPDTDSDVRRHGDSDSEPDRNGKKDWTKRPLTSDERTHSPEQGSHRR